MLLISQLQCYNRAWYRACICFSAVVANVIYAEEQKQTNAMCGNLQLTYSIWLGFCNHCDVVDFIYSPRYLFFWHTLHFKEKFISLISCEESFWIVKPDDGCYVQPKYAAFLDLFKCCLWTDSFTIMYCINKRGKRQLKKKHLFYINLNNLELVLTNSNVCRFRNRPYADNVTATIPPAQ